VRIIKLGKDMFVQKKKQEKCNRIESFSERRDCYYDHTLLKDEAMFEQKTIEACCNVPLSSAYSLKLKY
jgi:hypothetical protein